MDTESQFIIIEQGQAMLRGTQVSVQAVVALWASGVNMADIPSRLPELTMASVFAALRYHQVHRVPDTG